MAKYAKKKSMTITLDIDLAERLDRLAEEAHISRSGMISMCLVGYLQFIEMLMNPQELMANPQLMALIDLEQQKLAAESVETADSLSE